MAQKPKPLPPLEMLQRALDYNPETGVFTWRKRDDRKPAWNGRFAGKEAGYRYTNSSQSHYQGVVIGLFTGSENHLFQAHRIAWKLMTGSEPPDEIDHISGDALDNKWKNLRDGSDHVNVTNRKKYSNNSSGVTGVSKRGNRWRARSSFDGKLYHLGSFSEQAEAEAAVNAFRREHGFSVHHGYREAQQSKGAR